LKNQSSDSFSPNETQITAEQLIREARDRREDEHGAPPRQKIVDQEELNEYRLVKRKEFEDYIRRARWNIQNFVKYAQWEESQKDFARARSVWERAVESSHRSVPLWLKYAEMEMRNKNINHARNVWDRACTLLPRVDQLWYKYIHMEEMVGNIAGARQVFERWLKWEPDHQGWRAYIRMELRYNETDRARGIYERYVRCHPTVKAWVSYAKFEGKLHETAKARAVYETAVRELGLDANTTDLFQKFAKFEEFCKETERARAIYKYALDNIPKKEAEELYKEYMQFEKKFGDKEDIEDVINRKRRFQYEEDLRSNPTNYDTWFDYLRLEESSGTHTSIRELYERAIANVPPAQEKRFWKRYIYLWINYALYEELEAEDVERTREVYRQCLKFIPHKTFSFSKVWILAAQFEIRQKNLKGARKIYGMAIGMAPKKKIFDSYIEMEMQLGNVDRCRLLYGKHLEVCPSSCDAWCKFAELEKNLGEVERTRAIFELAVSQTMLDKPEILWKMYIDFEISEGERENARELYERLLERTKHVKVWISFARFESLPLHKLALESEEAEAEDTNIPTPEADTPTYDMQQKARELYKRAYRYFRDPALDMKEECVMLLEGWKAFESEFGAADSLKEVEEKMPRQVKRRRPVQDDRGEEVGMEEYYDYIFPDEAGAAPNLKLLQAAYKWKKQKVSDDS
jgi:crooked neck